jgi:outer membrane protein assembly factor BamB
MMSWKRIFMTTMTFLSASISIMGTATARDWPTHAHDNQRSSVTDEQLSPPLSLQWTYEPSFPPARGWPRNVDGYGAHKNSSNVNYDDAYRVVASGKVACFSASGENRVYAIDSERGEILWTLELEAAPRLAPTIWKNRVYLGADDGRVHCLDLQTGHMIWRFDAAPSNRRVLGLGRFGSVWPVRAGVMIEKGVAYFTAGLFPSEGIFLFALDAVTGKLRYRRSLAGTGNGGPSPQGYPLSDGHSLYLTSRMAPTRLDLATGRELPFSTPFPEVDKSHQYRFYNGGTYAQIWKKQIVYGQAALLAYDPQKTWKDKYGREKFGELTFNWFNARRALFHDGMAWIATDHHLLAVKQDKLPELAKTLCREFEEAYKEHRVASVESSLAKIEEVGADTAQAQAIREGTLKWSMEGYQKKWPPVRDALFEEFATECKWMTPLKANETMAMAGDVLYLGGEDRVIALDSVNGEILWKEETNSRVRGLAIADGRLYVSTIDGVVRCFGTGKKNAKALAGSPQAGNMDARTGKLAETILDATHADQGYCLVVGGGDGRLAAALAERSRLIVEVIDEDARKIASGRQFLLGRKLHGGRVNLVQGSPNQLPYPPYNFNLVIDLNSLAESQEGKASELARVTRPIGGTLVLAGKVKGPPKELQEMIQSKELDVVSTKGLFVLRRGKIPGSANWSHNYATAGNTYCSEDKAVKGPFGILWYGEPGPRQRLDRHARGPVPLVIDGIVFLTGYDLVMAYDVYNGTKYWERWIPGITRQDLPVGTSNLVADSKSLFVVADNKRCLQLDRLTGKTLRVYEAAQIGGKPGNWGWIAQSGGILLGSHSAFDTKRKRAMPNIADGLFAIDTLSGQTLWTYRGSGIEHDGVAVDGGRVLLVDRNLNDNEKTATLANRPIDKSVIERTIDRRGKPVKPDFGKLVSLNLETGKPQWSKPFDFSDLTVDDRVIGQRSGIACLVKDGIVVVAGIGSIGHPYQQYRKGEFARRALYAFRATDGKLLWGGRSNYRKRPIIVGDKVFAEPHAWNLLTGETIKSQNPLTGETTTLNYLRGYSGCDHLLASASSLFGNANSGGFAHYNLDEQAGFVPLGGMALACNTGAVPANGVFVAPEGRSGCTCSFDIQTSVVLYPWPKSQTWGFGARGVKPQKMLPVKEVAVNLGAPGFRTDSMGQLWIPYAGQNNVAGAFGKWIPKYRHVPAMFSYLRSETDRITGTNRPWIFSSAYHDEKELKFEMLETGSDSYTVKLHFIELDKLRIGERVFNVFLQGKLVLNRFDVIAESGGMRRTLTKTFHGVDIERSIRIRLKSLTVLPPVLSGFEARRTLTNPLP